jgi:hypothetical protein
LRAPGRHLNLLYDLFRLMVDLAGRFSQEKIALFKNDEYCSSDDMLNNLLDADEIIKLRKIYRNTAKKLKLF